MQVGEEARRASDEDTFNWLLHEGYYPEDWVLPDFFRVSDIKDGECGRTAELQSFAIPRSNLTSRYF